jgi:hypothetical protein
MHVNVLAGTLNSQMRHSGRRVNELDRKALFEQISYRRKWPLSGRDRLPTSVAVMQHNLPT